MNARLSNRLEKLEQADGSAGQQFYLTWVNPGEDWTALRRNGPAGVPVYCAEWKTPDDFARQGRSLGPRPASRMTDHHRISDDEAAVLLEAIADEQAKYISDTPTIELEGRGRRLAGDMTDRELIGAFITGDVQ